MVSVLQNDPCYDVDVDMEDKEEDEEGGEASKAAMVCCNSSICKHRSATCE